MKFRLLSGVHSQDGKTYRAKDNKANVVESDTDLAAKFGQEKFQKLDYPTDSEFGPPPETEDDDLDSMTVEYLKEYAAENEIDLHGATRKADILTAIRAAGEGE